MKRSFVLALALSLAMVVVAVGPASANGREKLDVEIATYMHFAIEGIPGLPGPYPEPVGAFTSNIPGCEAGTLADLSVHNTTGNNDKQQAGALVVVKQFECDGGDSFTLKMHGAYKPAEAPDPIAIGDALGSYSWSLSNMGTNTVAIAGNGQVSGTFFGEDLVVAESDVHTPDICFIYLPPELCAAEHPGTGVEPVHLYWVLEEVFTGQFVMQR